MITSVRIQRTPLVSEAHSHEFTLLLLKDIFDPTSAGKLPTSFTQP